MKSQDDPGKPHADPLLEGKTTPQSQTGPEKEKETEAVTNRFDTPPGSC